MVVGISKSFIPWSRLGPPFLTTPQVLLSGHLVHCGWCSQLSLSYSFSPAPSCPETRQLRTWQVLLANVEGGENTQWSDKLDTDIPALCRTSPEAKFTKPAFLCHCGPDSQDPSLSHLVFSLMMSQGWF